MDKILQVTIFCITFIAKICTAENIGNKSSAIGLVGSPNDAHFGKDFFILFDASQYLVYGHVDDTKDFTFWFGNVTCPKDPSEICDIRTCGGILDAKVSCKSFENKEEQPICQCEFPSTYPQTCGQPKLVLQVDMHYYEKDGGPQSETSVTTQNFLATCAGQVPQQPEPVIEISQDNVLNGDALQVKITTTQYVQIFGLPVYFWTFQNILIEINKTSLAIFLSRIEGIEHLVKMLSELDLKQGVDF